MLKMHDIYIYLYIYLSWYSKFETCMCWRSCYVHAQILTGTHWVWEIITMLLKQKAEYHPLTREHVFLDVIDDLSSLDTLPSPRVFNTHMPYRWLPREHFKAGRKVINVIRNPKDVAVSWYCHWHSSNELGCGSISWSEFFEEVVMGQCTNTNAFGCAIL